MIGYTKNKIMAFLLAVFLLAGLVPTAVFAEEAPTEAPETAAADEPGEKPMPLTEEPDEEPAAESAEETAEKPRLKSRAPERGRRSFSQRSASALWSSVRSKICA